MELIKINASIEAPVSKVWTYWNTPEHIVNWNFASNDWICPKAESDFRPGGKYLARMEAKDGSFGFDFTAVFDEIKDQKKVVYTIEDGRKVSTEFKSAGDVTEVTTVFEAESENPVEMQREGWQAILNNFKAYTENN
jgi:uncharacterized protein YndB with AHSA1/START domain